MDRDGRLLVRLAGLALILLAGWAALASCGPDRAGPTPPASPGPARLELDAGLRGDLGGPQVNTNDFPHFQPRAPKKDRVPPTPDRVMSATLLARLILLDYQPGTSLTREQARVLADQVRACRARESNVEGLARQLEPLLADSQKAFLVERGPETREKVRELLEMEEAPPDRYLDLALELLERPDRPGDR